MKAKFKIEYTNKDLLTLEEIRDIAGGGKPESSMSLVEACQTWLSRRDGYWSHWPEGSVFRDRVGNVIIRTPNNTVLFVPVNGETARHYHADTGLIASPRYCTESYVPEGN